MAIVVLDASVVIAFPDGTDALHERAVAALTDDRRADLVLPASGYAEALVMPYRRGDDAVERVDRVARDFAITIEPIGREIARLAAALRARHRGLRLPGALVLATGDAVDAERVLTGEPAWRRVSRRARLI